MKIGHGNRSIDDLRGKLVRLSDNLTKLGSIQLPGGADMVLASLRVIQR